MIGVPETVTSLGLLLLFLLRPLPDSGGFDNLFMLIRPPLAGLVVLIWFPCRIGISVHRPPSAWGVVLKRPRCELGRFFFSEAAYDSGFGVRMRDMSQACHVGMCRSRLFPIRVKGSPSGCVIHRCNVRGCRWISFAASSRLIKSLRS